MKNYFFFIFNDKKPQVLVSVNDDSMGQKSPINAEKNIFLPYTNIIHKVNFYKFPPTLEPS